jgi:hypothetical protein
LIVSVDDPKRIAENTHKQAYEGPLEYNQTLLIQVRTPDEMASKGAGYSLISPIATLIASDPSVTTTHRHPSRMSKVSMILAVIGLSSANKHVTALSEGSGPFLKSMENMDDDGVSWVAEP